jgi:hypothetical protein
VIFVVFDVVGGLHENAGCRLLVFPLTNVDIVVNVI